MPKLLAVDLDGTLFYPKQIKRCIPKKNVAFLQKWIDSGNKVILITSRSYEFVQKLKDEIQRPIDFILCSSSQIVVDGQIVSNVSMPRARLRSILKKINDRYHPLGFLLTTDKHACVIKSNSKVNKMFMFIYRLWWILQFKYREPFVLDNDLFEKELNESNLYKVMIFFGLGRNKSKLSKEINKELRENFPEIESSWSSIINELTPNGCNKGSGLETYCKTIGQNPDDVYVVGDSGNDITMFSKYFEHSYCMAHAYPSVKKYAKHIISRVYKLDKLVLKGEKNESI